MFSKLDWEILKMFPLSETGRFSGVLPAQRLHWSACRSGGRHLGKFAWGSNLALVFEVMQSRPSTTFPESWHDYWKQYIRSFGRRISLPDSPNWRCRQNYDSNKWQVWIPEAFLGRISASPGAWDGWHCWQIIPNYLPPYQEIDISCYKLSQNDNFVSKYPSSVATIWKLRFRYHLTPIFQPTPISDPGLQSSWASTWWWKMEPKSRGLLNVKYMVLIVLQVLLNWDKSNTRPSFLHNKIPISTWYLNIVKCQQYLQSSPTESETCLILRVSGGMVIFGWYFCATYLSCFVISIRQNTECFV